MKVLRTNASVFVWELHYTRQTDPNARPFEMEAHCVARSAQDAINMLKVVDPAAQITTARLRRLCGEYFGVLVDATALPTVAQSIPEITKKTKRRNRAAKTTKS